MYNNDFKTILGEPMEESRTNVTKDSIDLYFQLLSQMIDGTPVSLVYSIDKAGQDDFVDLYSCYSTS